MHAPYYDPSPKFIKECIKMHKYPLILKKSDSYQNVVKISDLPELVVRCNDESEGIFKRVIVPWLRIIPAFNWSDWTNPKKLQTGHAERQTWLDGRTDVFAKALSDVRTLEPSVLLPQDLTPRWVCKLCKCLVKIKKVNLV